MSNDDDWPDDDWSADEDDLVTCPECRAEVYLELNEDRCPECGHWFLESDRDAMWREASGGKPLFLKIVAVVVMLAMLLYLVL